MAVLLASASTDGHGGPGFKFLNNEHHDHDAS